MTYTPRQEGSDLSCIQFCGGAAGEISSIKAKSDLMTGGRIMALGVVSHAAPAFREGIKPLFVSVSPSSTNRSRRRSLSQNATCNLWSGVSPSKRLALRQLDNALKTAAFRAGEETGSEGGAVLQPTAGNDRRLLQLGASSPETKMKPF